jgi:hypothetical protein
MTRHISKRRPLRKQVRLYRSGLCLALGSLRSKHTCDKGLWYGKQGLCLLQCSAFGWLLQLMPMFSGTILLTCREVSWVNNLIGLCIDLVSFPASQWSTTARTPIRSSFNNPKDRVYICLQDQPRGFANRKLFTPHAPLPLPWLAKRVLCLGN